MVVHLHPPVHVQPVRGVLVLAKVQHHPVALGRQHVIEIVGGQRDGRHGAQQPGARHDCVLVVHAQHYGGKQQPPAEPAQVDTASLLNNSVVRALLLGGQRAHVVLHQLGAVAHVGAVRHARNQGGSDAAGIGTAFDHWIGIGLMD